MIYNTLNRKKDEFKPITEGRVNIFFCGLTVYDDSHLGHAKAFINFDVIVRWIRYIGYDVTYVQNITDVDDKIITRAYERHIGPMELSRYYEKRFLQDLKAIGVRKSINMLPRSHDYIEAINKQIQLLINNGFAYYLDGDIYYDVLKFKDYTKLSGMKLEELKKHRIEPKEGKHNQYDFALWKTTKPGEPCWKIELSIDDKRIVTEGRPGWHIEDTAITSEIFGPEYDIHGGANELIFPHHTNEIAQAEAAFGTKPFVHYWIHVGVFKVDGKKMSKSLGNFITIRSALEKHNKEALRLLFCTTHYRKDVNYSEAAIYEAEKRLGQLYTALNVFYNMKEEDNGKNDVEMGDIINTFKRRFIDTMNNDFNTPFAVLTFTSTLNRLRAFAEDNDSIGRRIKKDVIDVILEFGGIFGILESDCYKRPASKEVVELLNERSNLREMKKFSESDLIREKLNRDYHVLVEDTEKEQKWYYDVNALLQEGTSTAKHDGTT